jgi:hypothetical protein
MNLPNIHNSQLPVITALSLWHTPSLRNLLCLHCLFLGNGSQCHRFLCFCVHVLTGQRPPHNSSWLQVLLRLLTKVLFSLRHASVLRKRAYSSTRRGVNNWHSQSKPMLCYDWRSVGWPVLVSSPTWGQRPEFCYCQSVAGLMMLVGRSVGQLATVRVTPPISSSSGPHYTVTDMLKTLLGGSSLGMF